MSSACKRPFFPAVLAAQNFLRQICDPRIVQLRSPDQVLFFFSCSKLHAPRQRVRVVTRVSREQSSLPRPLTVVYTFCLPYSYFVD
jgi:hypothetical protein